MKVNMIKNDFTLLYVEDDNSIRENYSEIFREFFGNVINTDNGDDALLLYENNKVDVAILDININGLDGISVAEKLRKNDKELLILMMTAYSDKDKLLRAINLQLHGYLIKPLKTKELFTTLETIVKLLNKEILIALNGGFLWNESKQTLLYQNEVLKLTKHETMAIETLLEYKNLYLTACEIQEKIFTEKELGENSCNNIVQLLSRLKKKIETLNLSSQYFIENCYGVGYRITIN